MIKMNNLADIHNKQTMQELTILEFKAAIDEIIIAAKLPQNTICQRLDTAIDNAKSIADKIK